VNAKEKKNYKWERDNSSQSPAVQAPPSGCVQDTINSIIVYFTIPDRRGLCPHLTRSVEAEHEIGPTYNVERLHTWQLLASFQANVEVLAIFDWLVSFGHFDWLVSFGHDQSIWTFEGRQARRWIESF
jgi:hypothetical protein